MKKKNEKNKTPKPRKRGHIHELVEQIKTDKKAFTVYCIMHTVVILVMLRNIFERRWENVFVCSLALILFLIPPFVEKNFRVILPTTLQILIFTFIFCAEILGEIGCYYVKYPFWDTMLHTVNGFMFAAFGFCLVDIFNRNKRFRFELSPIFLSIVAFCFSMTVGILWEFFEFSADMLLATDMQKDFLVSNFASVTLDETMQNIAVPVKNIVQTQILTEGGETVVLNGYLDIGLIDTMKDLFVNFVGAVVFSIIGFIYVKQRGKGKIASQFIPVPTFENPAESTESDPVPEPQEVSAEPAEPIKK